MQSNHRGWRDVRPDRRLEHCGARCGDWERALELYSREAGERLEDAPARRGLLYWPGDARSAARIIFGVGYWIYALDPQTGEPIASFGENGRTALPTGATTVGAVHREMLVVA